MHDYKFDLGEKVIFCKFFSGIEFRVVGQKSGIGIGDRYTLELPDIGPDGNDMLAIVIDNVSEKAITWLTED